MFLVRYPGHLPSQFQNPSRHIPSSDTDRLLHTPDEAADAHRRRRTAAGPGTTSGRQLLAVVTGRRTVVVGVRIVAAAGRIAVVRVIGHTAVGPARHRSCVEGRRRTASRMMEPRPRGGLGGPAGHRLETGRRRSRRTERTAAGLGSTGYTGRAVPGPSFGKMAPRSAVPASRAAGTMSAGAGRCSFPIVRC